MGKIIFQPANADPAKNEKLARTVNDMVSSLVKYRTKLRE